MSPWLLPPSKLPAPTFDACALTSHSPRFNFHEHLPYSTKLRKSKIRQAYPRTRSNRTLAQT